MARTTAYERGLARSIDSVPPELTEMSKIAENIGYEAALEFIIRENPTLADYHVSNSIADSVLHCYDQHQRHLCLVLGTGLDNTCFYLTGLFEEVIVVEEYSVGLVIKKAEARHDLVANIRLLEAHTSSLPFRENEFDVIVADSMFEHIVPLAQVDVLRELWRILKPKGCLCLTARNRYGLVSWFSRTKIPTPRSTRPLPTTRSLVRFGNTDSLQDYASRIKEAGFGPIELYWTSPFDTHTPMIAGKLRDGNAYSFLARYYEYDTSLRCLAMLTAKLLPSRILQEICAPVWPTLLIFSWKHSKPRTTGDDIAEEMGGSSLVRMSCGSNVTYVGLDDHTPKSFGKLSRNPASRHLETQEELMSTYGGVGHQKRRIGNLTLFVESPIEGRKCVSLNVTDNRCAIDWLLRFQNSTASGAQTDIESLGERAVRALSTVDSDARNLESTVCQIGELADLLDHAQVSACSEHGDFHPGNIFISRTGKVSVADWELYETSGDPLFDFCCFLIGSSTEVGLESFVRNFSGAGSYSRVMPSIIRTFCCNRRLPVKAILLGIPYTLARLILRNSAHSDAPCAVYIQDLMQELRIWNDKIRYRDFSWIG